VSSPGPPVWWQIGGTIGAFLEKGEQMPNIGPLEIVLILIVALIVFGPKRLPELGRSMGKGIREFKNSVTGDDKDDDDVRELERAKREAAIREEEAPLEGEVVHDRRT
jgi:sec-independent protein translocase protein TatA